MQTTPTLTLPLRGREFSSYCLGLRHSVISFPFRGKVGMGILYCATPVLSFPLRGKVGMGVVQNPSVFSVADLVFAFGDTICP